MAKSLNPTDLLFEEFLGKARTISTVIEPIRVLRARTYKILDASVLIRASLLGKNRRYFFGINYIHVEEIANLDNPLIAFICGALEHTVILPANILFEQLPSISHDRNGEYKIVYDSDLNLVLNGRNNRVDCSKYVNAWGLISDPPVQQGEKNTAEQSLHTIVQGRLLEIGNIRGYQTYCPNKSKKFNSKPLADIATLKTCPSLQFSQYNLLRQIDVLWFRERGQNYIPECGFEVEISTGTWSGFGRLATLIDYENTRLYIISEDIKKFQQAIGSFADLQPRYKHIHPSLLGELYAAEMGLRELQTKIGL